MKNTVLSIGAVLLLMVLMLLVIRIPPGWEGPARTLSCLLVIALIIFGVSWDYFRKARGW